VKAYLERLNADAGGPIGEFVTLEFPDGSTSTAVKFLDESLTENWKDTIPRVYGRFGLVWANGYSVPSENEATLTTQLKVERRDGNRRGTWETD